MKGISTEAKVGLLVLLSMFILAFLTFHSGKMSFDKGKGYQLKVKFNSVAGLDPKARVKVSGVDAGYVKEINLVQGYPELTLWLGRGIEIREDAVAWVRSLGMMGEKYVEIEPGSLSYPLLKDGDRISKGLVAKDVDEMAESLGSLAEELIVIAQAVKKVVGTQDGQARLSLIVQNMEEMTSGMNEMVIQNQKEINRLVSNLADFSEELNQLMIQNRTQIAGIITDFGHFSSELSRQGPDMMRNISDATEGLKGFMDPNGYGLSGAFKEFNDAAQRLDYSLQQFSEITERVNRGEGTIGKLLTDDQVYEDLSGTLGDLHSMVSKAEAFSLHIGFRSEYLTEYEKSKSYFSLKFEPRKGKYYLLEFVDGFREELTSRRVIYDPNGVQTTVEEELEEKLMFNILMAQQFGPFFIKGGLMESTGGAGIDYNPFGENFSMGFEAWDFGETKPHLKLFASALIKKHFIINVGWDDFANSQRESFFAGAGFTFEDEDLKYLLSKLPLPGL
ncbi:MAG: MlaD family protein [bacterium]